MASVVIVVLAGGRELVVRWRHSVTASPSGYKPYNSSKPGPAYRVRVLTTWMCSGENIFNKKNSVGSGSNGFEPGSEISSNQRTKNQTAYLSAWTEPEPEPNFSPVRRFRRFWTCSEPNFGIPNLITLLSMTSA